MSKLRFHKRFIYVGVDISISALLTGGRSSYPLDWLVLYPRLVVLVGYIVVCVLLCYPRHGHVLYGTIIIKMMCVHERYLQG